MKKIINKLKTPFKIIKLLFNESPLYFILSFFNILIVPTITFISVYFPKIFIEKMEISNIYMEILIPILYFVLLLIILQTVNKIINYFKDKCSNKITKQLQFKVAEYAIKLDLYQLESPENKNRIYLAKNIVSVVGIFNIFTNIVSNAITILGLSILITSINFVYLIIIGIVLIIKIILNIVQFKYFQKIRVLDADNNRSGRYLDSCLYFNEGSAKEIRVNNLQTWFKQKIVNFRTKMINIQISGMRITYLFEIIMKIFVSLQTCVILILLSQEYINQKINIASFSMYFNSLVLLSNSLIGLINNILSYNNTNVNVQDFYELSILKNQLKTTEKLFDDLKQKNKIKLQFHNVSFKYPNTDIEILKNINVTINDKEKIAIVGLNGAGKTTFIKLICKFYIPTSGYITLNDVNIWEIDNTTYYDIISAVFQDFTIFNFTIKENIVMSQNNDVEVSNLLKDVGLNESVSSFYNLENSYISKQFDEQGIELSGGEKQKLAMARAIYKKSSLLILDEPTASLDVFSEKQIYEKFYELSKNKTVIFISHRLAISKFVDKIFVFKDGSIVESGNHDELIKNNSTYAEMYFKQVSYYEK